MIKCSCGKMTPNPKFCSKSCAAKHNNRLYPKRKATKHVCEDCGSRVSKRCYDICRRCSSKRRIDEFGNKRLEEFTSTAARHRYQNVRVHAHRIVKYAKWTRKCAVCEYSNHVELAHRKPIHAFHPTTLLKEVNALSNLVFLCPNHHWEMEHKPIP